MASRLRSLGTLQNRTRIPHAGKGNNLGRAKAVEYIKTPGQELSWSKVWPLGQRKGVSLSDTRKVLDCWPSPAWRLSPFFYLAQLEGRQVANGGPLARF